MGRGWARYAIEYAAGDASVESRIDTARNARIHLDRAIGLLTEM